MAARGQYGPNQYYRPYDSEDDAGSDSESSTTDSWYSSGLDQEPPPVGSNEGGFPNFRAFATQIQLRDAAGRNFSTIKDQIAYGTDRIGKYTTYSQFDAPLPDLSGEDQYGRTRFTTADGNLVSLLQVDSRYRDRQAYPQPTLLTLRLPRIYKNVTNVTLTDLKLLTSFYYFRLSKGNTDITVYEKDRTTLTYEGTLQSTIVKRYITEGSYNIQDLLAEIQLQLNYTPLFFDFINGFDDFVNLFAASGDFSLNFNQPGDYFYNNTTNLWIPNPTINTITTHFWNTRFAGLTTYNINQYILAYYYPVLNEYLFDEDYNAIPLNLQAGIGTYPGMTTTEDVRRHVLYDFLGITPIPDPVALAVINANKFALDKYRLEHTFRYWLVNKYIVGRDTRSQNVYITSPSLNTSLVNLLRTQAAKYLTRALQLYNLTARQYAAINEEVARYLAIITDMYNFHQNRFLDYFAVPWTQYTLPYYANLSNSFLLRNGIGAVGIPSTESQAINAGIVPLSNDILTTQKNEPPYYWPNLNNLSNENFTDKASTIFMVNLSTATSTLNLVYDMNTSNFNDRHTIVEAPNNYIYSEYLTKSANAVCPIDSAKYTVFKFRSPVRQTMQVETLPRPSAYRVPAYNTANFDSNINYYYDLSYTFTFTSTNQYPPNSNIYSYAYDNLPASNLFQIPGWVSTTSTFGMSLVSSLSTSVGTFGSNITLDVTTYNRAVYTTFTTPSYSNPSPFSSFTYSMNVGVQFYQSLSNISTLVSPTEPMRLFLYHDRAAFQADVLSNRNESPYFYKISTVINTADTSGTLSFTAYPNQEYYTILRPDQSNFGSVFPRIIPYFSNSFTLTQQTLSIDGINPATDIYGSNFNNLIQSNFNYAQVYDSNWIRLPIQSNLWPPDPTGDVINSAISISNVPIGYDTNGVSTDYTDYVPYYYQSLNFNYMPASNLGIDPMNGYQFQSNSPYSSTTQTFIYGGGLNYIFYPPYLASNYIPGIVSEREYKICHYYSPTYIPEPDMNGPLASNLISGFSNGQLPYTISTTLNSTITGYEYSSNGICTIQLGRGAFGFNFIPDEGVWDVKRIVFRSAIEDSNNDPNSNIQYLGIYNMGTLINTNTINLHLSSAMLVLSNAGRVTYSSNTDFFESGYDGQGGTYYEFIKDESFVPQIQLPVLGYTQPRDQMSDQPESMYTAIAFNNYGCVKTIKALSGSAIPYPFYNNPFISTAYLDGTQAYTPSQSVLFPSTIGAVNWPYASSISTLFAPQDSTSESQSQYALSIPIGTSVLNYKQGIPPEQNSNFFFPWTTTMTPNAVVASVSNYIMTQDTNFTIYPYNLEDPNRTFSTESWTLSEDQIYPSYETTNLVGVGGNNSYFYFLGLSNVDNNVFQVRMKRFNPFNGILYDYTMDSSFQVPTGGTLKAFTINDAEQVVLAYQNTTNVTNFYYNLQPSSIMYSQTIPNYSSVTMSMDPSISTLYWMPLSTSNQGISFYQWRIDEAFPGTQYTTSGTSLPPTWTGLATTAASNIPQLTDRLYFISQTAGYESNVYYANENTWNTQLISTPIVALSNGGQAITSITNGYNGGIWITACNQPYVWGNRNSEVDTSGLVNAAWQIFYPWQKIVLTKISNNYNPIVDLTYLDYPEYPHTSMFYYRDGDAYNADTKHKWGLESSNNFVVSDPYMSGYYFNSYIFNVPVVKSETIDDYQYLTIRGYTPTETSETLIRFNLPNVYDFGYATQHDLIYEISTLQVASNQYLFNSNYAWVLSNFDTAYQQSNSFFGQGFLPNFDGSNYNSSNFAQFASNYSTIYQAYQSNANLISGITAYVDSNIQYYISTQLRYIIPGSVLGRANYTDPLVFSLFWKSGLLPQYKNLLEDWGLGYNLGYAKIDTPFSTYHRASSFYKILEDYIFLRLNPQYPLNRMDNTYREDFKITRDSTGQIQNFYGKLLLNNFNTYSTTFIQNNQQYNPPIGRLDQMYFQWTNIVGQTIDNNDCDWSGTLAITETKPMATTASTIPALPPMNPPRK